MQLYYQILGLEPGASEIEIKRAYFKLIRKYPPESDPERFQQIREAYEHLKDGPAQADGPAFSIPSDPDARNMLEQIEKYRSQHNREKVRDTCEEAWKRFPDEIQFLYLQSKAQRECKNTGKAVKSSELLVKKDPDNRWFHQELAISYLERGFHKKALGACEKAHALGSRDPQFLLLYSNVCLDNFRYEKGLSVLIDAIRQDKKWTKHEMKQLLEIHVCLLNLNFHTDGTHLAEILNSFYQAIEQYGLYMKPYIPEISLAISHLCVYAPYGSEAYEKSLQIFDLLHSLSTAKEDQKEVDKEREEYFYNRMAEDSRIDVVFVRYVNAFYELGDFQSSFQKFALLDTQLCMLEDPGKILQQAEIIRTEYPLQYEKMADFIQKLATEKNLPYLKSKLQKTYQRLNPDFSFGYYYKLYPHEKKSISRTVINENQDEPYVNTSKKIGRNDPCPCGSGKKYKHCCMNK